MAGGNIVGDGKSSTMPNRNQLLKKKTEDNKLATQTGDQVSENKSQNDQSKFHKIYQNDFKMTTDKLTCLSYLFQSIS